MPAGDLVLVRCELARGGSSSERVFRIETAAGDTLAGVADIGYFFTPQQAALRPEDPPAGKRIPGLVLALMLRPENGSVLISAPDGNVASVSTGALVRCPEAVCQTNAGDLVLDPLCGPVGLS